MLLTGTVLAFVLTATSRANWTNKEGGSNLEEGQECHREGEQLWVCKRDTECEVLGDILRLNGRLRTCSWAGPRTHIVCCPTPVPSNSPTPVPSISPIPDPSTSPTTVPSNRQSVAKSEQKCSEYQADLCPVENKPFQLGPIYSSPQGIGENKNVSRRRKRQDTEIDDWSSLIDVHPYVGGHKIKQSESPNMQGERKGGDVHTQVYGGTQALPSQHPHMALIGYGEAGAITWQCGGSLISETFVLTAAHCVNTPYGLARWVRLGDLDLKSDTDDALPQEIEVVERVVHPGYKAPAYYNDLALLRLGRAAVFDRFVRPSCLHSDRTDPPGYGTAAGWGKNETNGPKSSSLMQVNIKIVPSEECKKAVGVNSKFLEDGVDSDTMICAGELGKDTCQGDSGGPLVLPSSSESGQCLARLLGVTSFGPRNCGVTSVPGAYGRVAHFLPWIESIVWPV